MRAPPAPADWLTPGGGQALEPLFVGDPGIDRGEFLIRNMPQRILAEQNYKPAKASDQGHALSYSMRLGGCLTLWRKCDCAPPKSRILLGWPRGFAVA